MAEPEFHETLKLRLKSRRSRARIDEAGRNSRRKGPATGLAWTIATEIGISILSGRLVEKQVLDSEVSSSLKLDVSRTSYREAIRILAAKGLVESRPKTGTKVTARSEWNLLDPSVINWTFANEPDWGLLQNLFELRSTVESQAAALASERRSREHLWKMRDALAAMERHSLATQAGRDADTDFHSVLLEATGNAYIISLTAAIKSAIATTTLYKQRDRPLRRDPVPDHKRVLDAVAAGKPHLAHRRMSELIALALEDTPVKRFKKRVPA